MNRIFVLLLSLILTLAAPMRCFAEVSITSLIGQKERTTITESIRNIGKERGIRATFNIGRQPATVERLKELTRNCDVTFYASTFQDCSVKIQYALPYPSKIGILTDYYVVPADDVAEFMRWAIPNCANKKF